MAITVWLTLKRPANPINHLNGEQVLLSPANGDKEALPIAQTAHNTIQTNLTKYYTDYISKFYQ